MQKLITPCKYVRAGISPDFMKDMKFGETSIYL